MTPSVEWKLLAFELVSSVIHFHSSGRNIRTYSSPDRPRPQEPDSETT